MVIARKNAPYAITIVAFVMRIVYARLDPFLHNWDERFHALVSRNFLNQPLIPLLRRNPIVPYDINSWCCNSVWLHKQPLFMWQSALSMKLFGVSEFSLRYPSVLLGTIMVALVFRLAILLCQNLNIAIIASLLMTFNYYQLELISGEIGMDHNDVSFSFYVLASFWSYLEFQSSNKLIFAILTGIFSGAAILNKWLIGLLVFLPWTITVAKDFLNTRKLSRFKNFLLAFTFAIAISLPWQIYILIRFTDNALYEYRYNSRHIYEALEGHSGNLFFYFGKFPVYFGYIGTILLVTGVILSFRKMQVNCQYRNQLLIVIGVVFAFFSFIAKTKMPSYPFIVVPLCILFIAISSMELIKYLRFRWLKVFILALILFESWKPWNSFSQRLNSTERSKKIHNTKIYKNLTNFLPHGYNTVINVNSFEDTEIMFYCPEINAYHWWLDTNELNRLKQSRIKLATFKNHGDYVIPDCYKLYPDLFIIPFELK